LSVPSFAAVDVKRPLTAAPPPVTDGFVGDDDDDEWPQANAMTTSRERPVNAIVVRNILFSGKLNVRGIGAYDTRTFDLDEERDALSTLNRTFPRQIGLTRGDSMTKTLFVPLLSCAAVLAGATHARAQAQSQPDGVFININVGAQTTTRNYTLSNSFPLYDETATFQVDMRVPDGVIYDVSVGYPVWNNVSVTLGFSTFSQSESATVTSTIPHPIFFNREVTTTTTLSDLKHREFLTHFAVMWTIKLVGGLDLALFAGPSVVHASQDVVATISVPPGTQDGTPVVDNQSGTSIGYNAGVDVSYALSKTFGVGAFVRQVGGTVDLDSLSNLKVGGLQAGAGIRIRF
jgi:hypothetical protein